MPARRLLLPVLLTSLAATAQSAAAASYTVDAVDLLKVPQALSADRAVERSCIAAPLAPGTPGVDVQPLTAKVDGFLDARLNGSAKGADWDLAVFDADTGKLLDGSAAFGGNEVVQVPVATGQRLTVQACRYGGTAAPVGLSVTEAVVSGTVPAVEKQSLVRIAVTSQEDVDRLQKAGIDLNETGTKDGIYAVLTGAADAKAVRDLGLPYVTTVPDLRKADATAARADADAAPRAAGAALPSGRTTYRTLAEYQTDLKKLVADHPGVVRPVTFAHKSIEGRTVEGVEIATGVERTDDGRPTVFQLGLHHAREWSSGEVTMEYALDLFKPTDAADGARKQRILDGERTFIFPVINPDGFVATQAGGSSTTAVDDDGDLTLAQSVAGSGSYRRKNCSNGVDNTVPLAAPCALQPGVDLNRNYGAFWGGPGESDNTAMGDYRGPAPFSEPETQNFHEFSSTHQVMIVNSNHNFAGDMLYQPGFHRQDEPGLKTTDIVPYTAQMKKVSDDIAAAAGYLSEVSYMLYDVTGATEDWNYFAQGAFGYTTEVGYDNFHPNYTDAVIDQYLGTVTGSLDVAAKRKTSKGVRESMLLTAEAGLNPAYHSQITGTAPAGRVLRLTKDFATTTSKVQTNTDGAAVEGDAIQIPEHLETTLKVPASGSYGWAVDPSTRPLTLLAGGTEAWTMSCEDAATHQIYETRKVTVAIGETSAQNFTCAAPAAAAAPTPSTGTTPTPAPTPSTTAPTGSSPTAVATRAALVILRPAFSARRTTKLGGLRLYLRLTGGSLKNVRATIVDAKGHVLLSGSVAKLTRSGRVALKRRATLRAGKVTVRVSATDARGRKVTAKLASRLVR